MIGHRKIAAPDAGFETRNLYLISIDPLRDGYSAGTDRHVLPQSAGPAEARARFYRRQPGRFRHHDHDRQTGHDVLHAGAIRRQGNSFRAGATPCSAISSPRWASPSSRPLLPRGRRERRFRRGHRQRETGGDLLEEPRPHRAPFRNRRPGGSNLLCGRRQEPSGHHWQDAHRASHRSGAQCARRASWPRLPTRPG